MLCLGTQSCPTLCNPPDCSPPDSSVHGDFPDKNTGVACHALLQGIFPIQGSNPGLMHCRWILCCLSHQESPRMLEWVAYPSSRGSSQPRNQTCIAGRFFTSWTTREAQCTSTDLPTGELAMVQKQMVKHGRSVPTPALGQLAASMWPNYFNFPHPAPHL